MPYSSIRSLLTSRGRHNARQDIDEKCLVYLNLNASLSCFTCVRCLSIDNNEIVPGYGHILLQYKRTYVENGLIFSLSKTCVRPRRVSPRLDRYQAKKILPILWMVELLLSTNDVVVICKLYLLLIIVLEAKLFSY